MATGVVVNPGFESVPIFVKVALTGRDYIKVQRHRYLGVLKVSKARRQAQASKHENARKPQYFGPFSLIRASILGYTCWTAGTFSAFHSELPDRGNRDI